MSVDTQGKIKGFVGHEEIANFIKKKWDKNVVDNVEKEIVKPLAECDWEYQVNEHSDDSENWYTISGFINFMYNDDLRSLFYYYNNINSFTSLERYQRCGLEDMVKAETTSISLGCYGDSVEIIKEIIAHFGGGWLDEDDCDDEEYYPIVVD